MTETKPEALLALRATLKRLNDQQVVDEAKGDMMADYVGPHIEADKALLAYVDDPKVTQLFEAIGKWYA